MVEAACIEIAKPDSLPEHEALVRLVARRIYNLILPLAETSFPGQEAIDEADALLIDLDSTDGAWNGEGARPPMEEFLARIAERLTQASLALGAAETDGNDPVAAARCLVREALPLAIALPVAFRTCRLVGDSSALFALQEGRQPARAPEPAAKPETAKAKEHHVLDAIALQASILLDVVDSAGRSCDLAKIHEALDAARVLTATIGSLADGMTDKPKASASEVEQLRAKIAELESKVGRFQGIPLPLIDALNAATGGNEWQGEAGPDALLQPACSAINALASVAPVAPPLCWVFEDELPESLTTDAYNTLYPHSRVDTVRMFPIFGPAAAAPAVHALVEREAAFEAVRQRLCRIPRWSFHLDARGNLRRVDDARGNWIEFSAAHELFDPVAVDAAIAAQTKNGDTP